MIIKSADDKSRRLNFLESLRLSSKIGVSQKNWLADEIDRTRKGIAGERDAAHYLDSYFRDSQNHMVLHDLRLHVDGETAQIDHLIINRVLDFFLLETKNFGGSVSITDHGEFSVRYPGGREIGIPSPIEQSRRHANVLRKVLKALSIGGRFGVEPNFEHVVLVHPKASIKRPYVTKFDSSNVIKADQFETWRDKHIDSTGVAATFGMLANVRSPETIRDAAERLARQHRPEDPLRLPAFMALAAPVVQPAGAPASSPIKVVQAAQPSEVENAKRLICMSCNNKISFAEGKFCWGNQKRFGGKQYCREHQAAF